MAPPAQQSASAQRRVVFGVSGGIAAYKACEVLRGLAERGHDVTVVPTESALKFVGETTWAALSGRPVATDLFANAHEVPHVRLGREADLVVVVPATANLLAKAVRGMSDDLLTATLLTARCPVVFAPAMHTEMWEHPATRSNVQTLRERGAVVLEPAVGRLTGSDSGVGRLPEPASILDVLDVVLARDQPMTVDMRGRRVVVTAGGTREAIDPVRFIGNRSSGRQGYALASTAVARGAEVVLISANVSLPAPAGVRLISLTSAAQMRDAVLAESPGADALVMAAAVADWRPASLADQKMKKNDDRAPASIELVETVDVLAEAVSVRAAGDKGARVIVGFAAETGDETGSVLDHGRAKLARKGADLLVVNDVGPGGAFESVTNAAVILGSDGSETVVERAPKPVIADRVWDLVVARWDG